MEIFFFFDRLVMMSSEYRNCNKNQRALRRENLLAPLTQVASITNDDLLWYEVMFIYKKWISDYLHKNDD